MNEIGKRYHEGPYEYAREWDFLVDFRTDPDAVARLLPDALERDPDSRAWLRVSHHKTSSFGPYIGAYVGVYAQHEQTPVRYIASGLKTDFMGTIAAREIWGLPYGLGTVAAGWRGSTFHCSIFGHSGTRNAEVLLQTTSRQTRARPGVAACYTAELRDHCGNLMTTQLLKAQNAYDLGGADAWDASASLQLFRGTAIDDWSIIPVGEVVHAEYRTGGNSSLAMASVLAEW
ncbi:acetoacetate decarboxylase family protein [Nocardia wallacei]|uniref:acetoacetate decarboxylase family protein n=1 Tax=Nocardia wallacei TaxID=480035 RepID=UPI00245865C4|nr:acetoacetate decarboxylase family protein [Nocardia wallacei]